MSQSPSVGVSGAAADKEGARKKEKAVRRNRTRVDTPLRRRSTLVHRLVPFAFGISEQVADRKTIETSFFMV